MFPLEEIEQAKKEILEEEIEDKKGRNAANILNKILNKRKIDKAEKVYFFDGYLSVMSSYEKTKELLHNRQFMGYKIKVRDVPSD